MEQLADLVRAKQQKQLAVAVGYPAIFKPSYPASKPEKPVPPEPVDHSNSQLAGSLVGLHSGAAIVLLVYLGLDFPVHLSVLLRGRLLAISLVPSKTLIICNMMKAVITLLAVRFL